MAETHLATHLNLAPQALEPEDQASAAAFGVGARITISVMSDDYVAVILGALAAVDTTGLVVETTDVSTFIGGEETALQRYVVALLSQVAATGKHASVSVHLSRGCPGEVACSVPGGVAQRNAEVPEPQVTGTIASAEWALYPLADDVRAGVVPDHMRDIEAVIELARTSGIFRGSEHFVTRLEGDLGTIISTVVAGWVMVGRTVQHVTSHLTVSLNSPSHTQEVAA